MRCLSAIRDLKAAEYGLAEISRDFLAELPNITGPPYKSWLFSLGDITSLSIGLV